MGTKEDLQKYPLFVYENGILKEIEPIDNWNNYKVQIHHYIAQQKWKRNEAKYKAMGLEQKLFIIPIAMHEHLHNTGIKCLSDEQFYKQYGIRKDKLIYRGF